MDALCEQLGADIWKVLADLDVSDIGVMEAAVRFALLIKLIEKTVFSENGDVEAARQKLHEHVDRFMDDFQEGWKGRN